MRLSRLVSLLLATGLLVAGCGRSPAPIELTSELTVDGRTLTAFQAWLEVAARQDRGRGVRQLPGFGTDALPVLERALGDEHGSVRAAALTAIGELAPDNADWAQRVARHLVAGEPTERMAAGEALARIGEAAVPALCALLESDDQNLRDRAALVAARLPGGDATEALWAAMASDASWIVRRESARGLARQAHSEPAKRAIETLVSDDVPAVQELAADAAARHTRDVARLHTAVAALLDSPHGRVRGAAAEALGHSQDENVQQRLLDMARADTSAHARVRAAVGHWRSAKDARTTRATLLAALDHRRTEVRRLALRCIGELGTDAGTLVQEVAQRLDDRAIRTAAIDSLTRLGPAAQAAIPALQSLRTRSKPYTARRIDVALEQIGG